MGIKGCWSVALAPSCCPKSMRSSWGCGGGVTTGAGRVWFIWAGCCGGMGFFSMNFWPGRIGVIARICSDCCWGVEPLLFSRQ